MNTTAAPTNGKKPQPQPPQQSPEELAVAHGIANYQRVVTERDALQTLANRQEQMHTVAHIEIEGLRAELAAAQSRIASYQHERDDAVANLAIYQTLFIAFNSLLRTFGIEHAPLIKEPHADAS